MSEYFNNLFIFEMANNHQGSVEHGLNIIEAMGNITRKYGIRAGVKFQYRDLDTFIHPDYRDRNDVKHIPRFLSTRLTDNDFETMIDAVRRQSMLPIVTPFDERSVQKCVDHGIEIIKVASCSVIDWPLLEAIVTTEKPVIVSTGGALLPDIDRVVSFFTHRHCAFALLHCVGVYPTPNHMLHMNFIDRLTRRYPGVSIGYSGHEAPTNTDVVKVAVSKGATILERHVGMPTDTISLNAYSMTPEQVDTWVAGALAIQEILGDSAGKLVSEQESDSLRSLMRGVYARKDIPQGSIIQSSDVFFAMPCTEGQITSGQFGSLRATFTASKAYNCNEPIMETAQPDAVGVVRSLLHEARGMLNEAQILLGEDFELEISHHYGIEHFRQVGAFIVNLVNREYCKKLIVVLPEQHHPSHCHKIKEETFQLLWGDLEVNLNGRTVRMQPGDMLLIERNTWHSFTSYHGAIFEEISTNHVRNDSYYEDERIKILDPMQRKTILRANEL